jgi:DNA repair exonuclease SbcCD nuclease subunit
MAKILLVGDVHIMDKNISSIDLLETQILKTIEEEKIDECIVLGDILHNHERLKSIPHNRAHKFLKDIASKVHTFVLVGNHDYINNSQFLSENHWMECLKGIDNLVVVDKVMKYNININVNMVTTNKEEKKNMSANTSMSKDMMRTNKEEKKLKSNFSINDLSKTFPIRLCLCPYVPNGRYIEALHTKIKDIRKESDFYFSHVCVNNMKMGAIVVNDADDWKEDFPPLFVGHEHTFQVIAKNCICTGSSISTSSSEGVDKYLVVIKVDLNDSKSTDNKKTSLFDNKKSEKESKCNVSWSYDKIILDLPRNKTIYYKNVQELKDSVLKSVNENDESEVKTSFLDIKTNCSYRLVVHGPEEEFKAFTKTSLYHELSLKARLVWKESHMNGNDNNTALSSSTVISRTIDFSNKEKGFFEIFLEHIKDMPDLLKIYNELYGEENE